MRKLLHRRQSQARDFSQTAEVNIDRFLFGRFEHLLLVKRFVGGWVLLWLLLALMTGIELANLSPYYQSVEAVPGGIYSEGILGTMTNVNPIYATNPVDTSLSHLLFAGLFTHNAQNNLVGCLASGYSIDKSDTVYTVKLKHGLTWQDGRPLTAADVVFTYDMIQNPDSQSPLYSSWQGIKVNAPNSYTVTFTLPNPLASFPYNLTTGILPQHILGSIAPSDLRNASFNTNNPIGAGPFMWHALQVSGDTPQNASEQIALLPFRNYVLGRPKLSEFIVDAFADNNQLLNAFKSGQLTAMTGIDAVPGFIKANPIYQVHSRLLTVGDYVFFKTNSGVLSDATVRQALVMAADPAAIIARLGYFTFPVNEPLLIGQLAYNPKYAQSTNKLATAQSQLAQAGWTKGKNGILEKNNQPLSFNLVATDTPENRLVASMLKQQWLALGASVQLIFESSSTYTTTLEGHSYDSTLNGISIGNDPDVFVYWDKSQFDPRSSNLNFSDYSSNSASQALEAGRTRLDPKLRVIKYQPFLADWQKDAPALGLFQPRFIYITNGPVYGMGSHVINAPYDRFDNVQNWEILRSAVTDLKQN